MKPPDTYKKRLAACPDLSDEERGIISDYVYHRGTISPTCTNTKIKQAAICTWVVRILHQNGKTLKGITVDDLLQVINAANNKTKNSRQTYIVTLKAFATYLNRRYQKIENIDLLDDVKAGSADRNRKEALTLTEWDQVLNCPMPARDRALIALMYDGYHRPGEVIRLRWCDMKNINEGIEYTVKFKTEKERTIRQKPGTTAIMELWRRECGAKEGSEAFIFPDKQSQKPYESIFIITKIINRIKDITGIKKLMPSAIRTTALTHDVNAGLPISYICLRAWGAAYNPMINVYVDADSAKIQREQHQKDGMKVGKIIGTSGKFSIDQDPIIEDVERLRQVMTPEDMIAFWTWKKDHP